MIRKLMLMFAFTAGFAVSACNTVEGVGEDVSSAGEAVSDAAK